MNHAYAASVVIGLILGFSLKMFGYKLEIMVFPDHVILVVEY